MKTKTSLMLAATALTATAQSHSSASSSDVDADVSNTRVFYAGIAATGLVFFIAAGLVIHAYQNKIKNCFGLFTKQDAQDNQESIAIISSAMPAPREF